MLPVIAWPELPKFKVPATLVFVAVISVAIFKVDPLLIFKAAVLIESLAVIVEALLILMVDKPLVDPSLVPDAKLLLPFKLRVPVLLAEPSIIPTTAPVPIVKVELEAKEIADAFTALLLVAEFKVDPDATVKLARL